MNGVLERKVAILTETLSFPNFSIIFLFPSALAGVQPLKCIQKYNNVFFQSLQDSLTAQSPKCKIILSFTGPWFCFGRFVSYLSYLFFVLVLSLVSVVLFRCFGFSTCP